MSDSESEVKGYLATLKDKRERLKKQLNAEAIGFIGFLALAATVGALGYVMSLDGHHTSSIIVYAFAGLLALVVLAMLILVVAPGVSKLLSKKKRMSEARADLEEIRAIEDAGRKKQRLENLQGHLRWLIDRT